MAKIKVVEDKCTGCTICLKSCPFGAITLIDRPHHPKKRKLGVIDLNKCNFCGACVEACEFLAIHLEKEEKTTVDLSGYKGVWVYAEQHRGEISPVVYELLGEGRKLAHQLQVPLSAVLLGSQITAKSEDLIQHGADKVYVFDDPIFENFQDEPYAQALADLIKDEKPEIVLMGATNIGRSFASRVAAKIGAGLTADCTELAIDAKSKNLLQTRPAFGGNIMATILTPNHRPQMSTVRHKVMKKAEKDSSRKGEVIKRAIDAKSLPCKTKFLKFVPEESATVNLAEADIICSGGRGLGNPDGFKLIEEFAKVLGGSVGSSRAAVDAGWIPYSHQVGQTGRTVGPKIYFACGISGAIQHLVGMSSSDIIIAINKDPNAPMMKLATFALSGDLYEIIPAIIKEIKKIRGEN